MTDLEKILLTALATVIGGVLVLAAGQLVIRGVLDPVYALKKHIGEIEASLVFYANAVLTPEMWATDEMRRESREEAKAARNTLRQQGAELWALANALSLYGLWARVFGLPPKSGVREAMSGLIGLNNSVYHREANLSAHRKQVEVGLRLRPHDS